MDPADTKQHDHHTEYTCAGSGRRSPRCPSEPMATWTKDESAASWYTRLYIRGMRLARDKTAFEGAEHTFAVARQRQRKGNRPPTWRTRLTTRARQTHVAGIPVWTVRSRRRSPTA